MSVLIHLIIAISVTCSKATEKLLAESVSSVRLRANQMLDIPHLSVLPSGVGQMLPMAAYGAMGAFDQHDGRTALKASKPRAKNTVRRARRFSSLAQFREEFSWQPSSESEHVAWNGQPDQGKHDAEKAIEVEVQDMKAENAVNAVTDVEGAIIDGQAKIIRSVRKPSALSLTTDSTIEEKSAAAASLKASAKVALKKAATLELAADMLDRGLQEHGDEKAKAEHGAGAKVAEGKEEMSEKAKDTMGEEAKKEAATEVAKVKASNEESSKAILESVVATAEAASHAEAKAAEEVTKMVQGLENSKSEEDAKGEDVRERQSTTRIIRRIKASNLRSHWGDTEVQATGKTSLVLTPDESAKDYPVSDSTVHATASSKTASEAAKVAVDAAQTAAQHAKEAQKAADTMNVIANDAKLASDSAQKATDGTSANDGMATTRTGVNESDTKERQTHAVPPLAVPAQVTQGIPSDTVRYSESKNGPDEVKTSGQTQEATATQATHDAKQINDANKIAQAAATVAQSEAFRAADIAAQAAAVTATAADEQGTKTSEAGSAKQAENVAGKAHQAEEAAMRATAAARVAEQKADEATDLASEAAVGASGGSTAPTDATVPVVEESNEINDKASGFGAMFALLLGLAISVFMFSGLMFLFTCGDSMLKRFDAEALKEQPTRGSLPN